MKVRVQIFAESDDNPGEWSTITREVEITNFEGRPEMDVSDALAVLAADRAVESIRDLDAPPPRSSVVNAPRDFIASDRSAFMESVAGIDQTFEKHLRSGGVPSKPPRVQPQTPSVEPQQQVAPLQTDVNQPASQSEPGMMNSILAGMNMVETIAPKRKHVNIAELTKGAPEPVGNSEKEETPPEEIPEETEDLDQR